MYTSLDRVDMATTPIAGFARYIQTDHRTTEEMQAQPHLSTLMALVRVLNATRMGAHDAAPSLSVYTTQHPAPPFLRAAIECAGGVASLGVEHTRLPGPALQASASRCRTDAVCQLVDHAAAGLAEEVCVRERLRLDIESMEALEARLTADPPKRNEDERRYWTAVMELGAFGGEILRRGPGGRWGLSSPQNPSTLPLQFHGKYEGSDAVINLFGKVTKLLDNGPEDSVVSMVRMLLHCS